MSSNTLKKSFLKTSETGTALVIALLVMVMLLGFAALALSRAVSETAITNNDTAESRSYSAAEAALEDATRDFATLVENKLVPSPQDITDIKNSPVPYFSENNKYTFTKNITQTGTSQTVTQTKGEFQGLISLRDEWQIDVTAHDNLTGVETQVRRRFFNDRIPIFQFGAFYDDDLELNRPPLFVFGGRVHTNGNLFISAYPISSNGGIYFKSKLTAAGEIVNDIWKTGTGLANPWDNNGDIYVPNANDVNQKLSVGSGSVTCGGTGNALVDPTVRNGTANAYPYPKCQQNPGWNSYSQKFEGNLIARASKLKLPVAKINEELIEMVRRGKNVGDLANIAGTVSAVTAAKKDNDILSKERFANKQGIRISLADSKSKLPQCNGVTTACGVRLDGAEPLVTPSLGYQPLPMTDGYTATALNGNRIAISGREVWIKIELVDYDYNNGVPIIKDVTEDILSLGITEPAPIDNKFKIVGYSSNTDTRSIVKLQRFVIPGQAIPNPSGTNYLENKTVNSNSFNAVVRYQNVTALGVCVPLICSAKDVFASSMTKTGSTGVSSNESAHYKISTFNNYSSNDFIVPFPIQVFDAREGARNDSGGGLDKKVYKNGVMSMVDIDVANLRRFLKGDFDGKFPATTPFAISNGSIGLKSTNVPEQRGWVVYFSDRRGDADFDGMYDMEDVNPNSNSLIDEDLNNNGTIDTDYTNEAPSADSSVDSAYAAVVDHTFYRRGVRLINGTLVPGKYDSAAEGNTKGFTFSSENGIYVLGNFNVSSVSLPGGSQVADSTRYSPLDSSDHIPSAIIGDSVTILSNAWNDSKSFAVPFDDTLRVASNTQVRFGMIAGDSLTAKQNPIPAAGTFEGLNGGIHNFKRFLEDWETGSKRLNYSGSLINLYNSFNNDGRWKCCEAVYKPPVRDWTFESSFTNPNRLPPGTPFVYYMTFTGFERVNE